MSSSSISEVLSSLLKVQSASSSYSTAAGSGVSGGLSSSADFAKLLELQMNQSMLNLSALGSSDDSSQGSDDNSYASLMGLASGSDNSYASLMGLASGSDNSTSQSLMLLQAMETLVDRLAALEKQMAPAAATVAAAASAAASTAVNAESSSEEIAVAAVTSTTL